MHPPANRSLSDFPARHRESFIEFTGFFRPISSIIRRRTRYINAMIFGGEINQRGFEKSITSNSIVVFMFLVDLTEPNRVGLPIGCGFPCSDNRGVRDCFNEWSKGRTSYAGNTADEDGSY
ncbi:hypothetical protein JTB14_005384 [Gonioctena quinquepunctata]|nr:hypothetical protein JTB14_005384 [Gonioctena quinquepunctata]